MEPFQLEGEGLLGAPIQVAVSEGDLTVAVAKPQAEPEREAGG